MNQHTSRVSSEVDPLDDSAQDLKSTMRQASTRVASAATMAMKDARTSITTQANALLDDQRTVAGTKVASLANALRESAQGVSERDAALGGFMNGAADRVQDIATYIGEHDLRHMYRQTEQFARQHPALFLGGLFVAGTLAARFLKASGNRDRDKSASDSAEGSFGDGYTPDEMEAQPFTTKSRIASEWPD